MLTSWKEIARFFDRDARTVQRWEKREGLPVHRHRHQQQSSVYAYPEELAAWWLQHGAVLGGLTRTPARPDILPAPADDAASTVNESPRPDAVGPRQPQWMWGSMFPRIATVVLAICGGLVVIGIVTGIPAKWSSLESSHVLATLDGSVAHSLLREPHIGDLNDDGRNDLVIAASAAREIYVLFGGSIPKTGRLASAASVTIRGSENGGYIASAVADLDGDGVRDLLVRVQLREPDTFRATGATYLLRGRRTWPSSLQLPGAADVTFRFTPPKEIGMGACSSVNPIDLNRDGIEDIVLGGADYSPPGGASAGGVFVLFGRKVWPAEIDVERDAAFAIHGFRAGEGLTWPCGAGDFNGDGRTDLAVLALEHTLWNMLGSRSRYYLFFGRDQWPRVLTSERDADLRIEGERPHALAHPPVLADLNGDGFDDLIVGSSRTTDQPPAAAQIAVFFGAATPKATVHAMSTADVIIEGESGPAELGASISAADLDGDGMDDLILTEAGPGRVHVLFGRSRWPGRGRPDRFDAVELFRGEPGLGREGLQIGDLDEDGLPELLVSSSVVTVDGRENAGRAWLLKPHGPITIDVRPEREPNVLYLPGVLVAKVAGASLAADDPIDPGSVRLAGVAPTHTQWRDFDRDGTPDLLVYFDTREMRVTPATTRVTLTARTRSGRLVAGHDGVTVLPGTADQLSGAGPKPERRRP